MGPIGPTELIIAFPGLLFILVIGLAIIASGQVFLAIRETALNTRKEESKETSQYNVLFTVAKIWNFGSDNISWWRIRILVRSQQLGTKLKIITNNL
jgi:hypothetical protein